MNFSQGVEWGLHCAAVVARAPDGTAVPRRVLAAHFGLPEAYLAKHLKALVRAGVLSATPGPKGGFRLARPAAEITALDILEAIEGAGSPFVCQEIRQQGTGAADPADCTKPCAISAMMDKAHQAWQQSLRQLTLTQIVDAVPPALRKRTQPGSRATSGRAGNAG